MEKSSSELGNEIAEKELELSEGLKAHQEVEQAILLLQRDILGLQHKKKELEIALSKASHNNKMLQIQIKLLTNEFWSTKNAGL